ncbi:MAG: hypothetical protein KKG09_03010 [Verrucomicrobia bacterium]|nr:hypothetical protein [Verrucomicrobiota bacterium]MCG2681937.1 hypothetical protein [Kiritimatiellia bacterium]MBU4247137.1 hypothetical protein [Verrucomicrobiota bacterium]MBU4290978.1 hypothetical protein [Verrucomicrobiota bacterium]MBU4430427.1 hypothetical protein [Verrucomicrobiota bacterium]
MNMLGLTRWTGLPGNILRAAFLGVLLGCWPFPASAQLAVELQVPSSKALLYESVIATVTFRNHSGQVVLFDPKSGCARVRFDIEMGEGKLVNPLSATPLLSGVELTPGEARVLKFNIPRLYAIQSIGLYKVRAVVDYGGMTYASVPAYLEVARGFELKRLMAGVPDDPRVSRTYVLEYMQKDTSEENLYLRIEDETAKRIYGMFNLGRIVRVRMPDLQVDESGNVHILFQTPGTAYVHLVFTPYGVPLVTENIPGGKGNVALLRMPNGRIAVTGSVTKPARESGAESGSVMESGPVTKVKKATGGLFGKPEN